MSPEEKKESNSVAIASLLIAAMLIVFSATWLTRNLDEIFNIFKRDDPPPTVIATPEGAVEAALYAECQEQLKGALEGLPPVISDADIAANDEYLNEARKAIIRLEDLTMRGREMFDELKARESDTPEEYRDEWNGRAQEFRVDLYKSVDNVKRLGMSDPFARLHSEIFLAYHWLDRYSDQINGFFTDEQFESISAEGINQSGLHLDTANILLQRSQ